MDSRFIEFGLSDFITHKKNVLFITGLMGSGKSTLADEFADKYNAELIGLDYVWKINSLSNIFSSDEYITPIYELLEIAGYWKRIDGLIGTFTQEWELATEGKRSEGIIKAALQNSSKSKRYILEGVHLYQFDYLFKYLLNNPLVLMSTSASTAFNRNNKRSLDRGQPFIKIVKDFSGNMTYYKRHGRLWREFVNKIKNKKKNIDTSALESFIFSEAMEGLFVKGNQEPIAWMNNLLMEYGYPGTDSHTSIIHERYIREVSELWTTAPDLFVKNGKKLLTTLRKEIDDAFKFASDNQDKVYDYHLRENYNMTLDLNDKQLGLCPTFVKLSTMLSNGRHIFIGPPVPIPFALKTQIVNDLKHFEELSTICAHRIQDGNKELVNAPKIKFISSKYKRKLLADSTYQSYLYQNVYYLIIAYVNLLTRIREYVNQE